MTVTAQAAQTETETAAQRARRARIITATLSLASRGGYEAVQMREVAERSEVALGTLYRYFPSKVHLLVSAMASEVEQLSQRLQKRQTPARPVPSGWRTSSSARPGPCSATRSSPRRWCGP